MNNRLEFGHGGLNQRKFHSPDPGKSSRLKLLNHCQILNVLDASCKWRFVPPFGNQNKIVANSDNSRNW
jgi:hypothetical protein